MLKYLNTEVTFAEIPDEITLCINITGCPNHCEGCHSSFLWEDVGELLSDSILDIIIPKNKGITCICFMGGDGDPKKLNFLAKFIRKNYPDLKIAWYSGKEKISGEIQLSNFDYIKIGPYIKDLGGLDNPNTNQKLFLIEHSSENSYTLKNITSKFWKNGK